MKKHILIAAAAFAVQVMLGQDKVQVEEAAKKAEQKHMKSLALLAQVSKVQSDSLAAVYKSVLGSYTAEGKTRFDESVKAATSLYVSSKLNVWRKDVKSIETKNKCPNCPMSIAISFIKACMNGELNNALKYAFKKGDKLSDNEDTHNVLTGKLGLEELTAQAKTNPAGASTKLKEPFMSAQLEPAPIVIYDAKNEHVAYVVRLMKVGGKCCANLKLEKINGIWKVIAMDDYFKKIKDQESLEKEMSSIFKHEFWNALDKR